jgi:hypothetical protein
VTRSGFAIVSSDSDFTPLATRLRESGKRVIGVGRRTTPKAFVVLRLDEQGGGRRVIHDAPSAHNDDVVGHGTNQGEVMRHEQQTHRCSS